MKTLLSVCIVAPSQTYSYTHKCSLISWQLIGQLVLHAGSISWASSRHVHTCQQFTSTTNTVGHKSTGKKVLMSYVRVHWAAHRLQKAEGSVQTTINPIKRHSGTDYKIEPVCFTPVWQSSRLAWFYRNNNVSICDWLSWARPWSSGHTAASCFHPGPRNKLLTNRWTIHLRPS